MRPILLRAPDFLAENLACDLIRFFVITFTQIVLLHYSVKSLGIDFTMPGTNGNVAPLLVAV